MARVLSDDLRHRILAASAGWMSARSAAARFGIGFDGDCLDRERPAGSGERCQAGSTWRFPSRRSSGFHHRHDRGVEGHHAERDGFASGRGPIRLYPQHPRRLAAQARLHVQKKTAHALEQERPDLLKRRQDWFDAQLDLDPARLVFIDETGLSTKMSRLRGRSPRGERCRSGVPHGSLENYDVHRGAQALMSSRFSCRPSRPATSSSWTTCRPTRQMHPTGHRNRRLHAALSPAL